MKKSKISLFALLLLPIAAFAQENKVVSGIIKSTDGKTPLAGVEVFVEGTDLEAFTDENGYYEIEVPEDATLTILYDGYQQIEIPIKSTESFDFSLNPLENENKQLEEVVVIGYGKARKSDLTGSVGVIDASKLTERSMTNPMEAMQGNVPGVQISTSTGRIGDGFDIVIRGNNSMNADSKPLFVVDGVPTSDIDFLNPQDIARIDILKDASSTAIYGSRGSNGVVIVTTKNGSNAKGRFTVSYDTYYGVKDVARLPKMMDGSKWWYYHQSAYLATAGKDQATGQVSAQTLYNAVVGTRNTELLRRVNANETFDWFDAVLRTGMTQNNYVNLSGRSENGMGYNIGLGAQKEKGNLQNEALDKYSVNIGVDHRINDKFSVGINLNVALTEQQDGSDIAMQEAFRLNPFLNPYQYESTELAALPGKLTNQQGAFIIDKTSTYNPLLEIKNTVNETRRWNGIGNFFFEYRPLDWLSLKTTYSANYDTRRKGESWGALTSVGASNNNLSSAAINKSERFNYTWDNQVNANFEINDIHKFNILALQSIYESRYESSFQSSRNIPFETGYHNIGSGTQETYNIGSDYIKQALSSYALRANYSLLDKYLFTFSIRWDGSSILSKGNQWESFPSAAVAWKINNEEFLKASKVVSELKLRASWGYTGNNIIEPYSTTNLLTDQYYYDFNGTVANGWLPGKIANPYLTWEKTREFNVGLDYGFFKNRITGSIDIYDKLSDYLLMKQQLPYETGWTYINGNIGSVSNKGVEIALTAKIVQTKKVSWETTFTFSKNVNKIKSIYGQNKVDDIGNNLFIGESIHSYYNYVFDGVWQPDQEAEAKKYGQTVGQAKVKDINGDGKITVDDRVILGSSDPDWSGSIFTTLKVGQFDLSASLITNQGVLAYSPFHENFTNVYDRGRSKIDMDWFVPTNDAELPAQFSNTAPQPYNEGTYWKNNKVGYYRDASFVKVKNIALGYTFDKNTLSKIGLFNSLRVYANVINPFVFTDYNGYDPEWATANFGIGRVSSVTYQLGLNVKF
ncbi:TonB-dependent receptor [Empedobacter falsenii]|uniref:SusC/RagA family TonB-linked outer membrane protein n=1 Tax=Empedobacter falsenii TaxID=343874 RepID=UPI0025788E51|nr:TonB-dependent receptor [Empedobacter falsenii]MDM1061751.1 TonB-dependent receptor [Empedobacter falsenii]